MSNIRIASIFHPSDFSETSEVAFVHALKVALVARATLHMLHVDSSADSDWCDFPGVRTTLERWGLIPEGSPRSAVIGLGIDVEKVIAASDRPVRACLRFLERHPADLIVLAVRRHEGRVRWLEKRIGAPIAREAAVMTLFIPQGVQGFVSSENGGVSLTRILIAAAEKPRAQAAVDAVLRLIRNLGLPSGEVTVLHVGDPAEGPPVVSPSGSNQGWTWRRLTKPGEPAEVIVQTADELSAGLIAMTTAGSLGFLDALRARTTERVLSRSLCPVLSLPEGASSEESG